MKRTPLKRKTPLKAKTGLVSRMPLKRSKWGLGGTKDKKMSKHTGKEIKRIREWWSCIPDGSHGSKNNRIEKKCWKMTSDIVRKGDFDLYDKRCVSFEHCGNYLEDWKDGDAAHFERYSLCCGTAKMHMPLIALSCKGCNKNDSGPVMFAFAKELERRGVDVVKESRFVRTPQKPTYQDWENVLIERYWIMDKMESKPDYFYKIKREDVPALNK